MQLEHTGRAYFVLKYSALEVLKNQVLKKLQNLVCIIKNHCIFARSFNRD